MTQFRKALATFFHQQLSCFPFSLFSKPNSLTKKKSQARKQERPPVAPPAAYTLNAPSRRHSRPSPSLHLKIEVDTNQKVPPPSRSQGAQRFPKSARLLTSRDFRRAIHQRELLIETPHFEIAAQASGLNARAKLGISISRKVGHAPCRAKIKRRVREVFRRYGEHFSSLILHVKVKAKRRGPGWKKSAPSFQTIYHELVSAAQIARSRKRD